MPRKPLGDRPMTSTERVQRHRAALTKAQRARRRAQRRHAYAERGPRDPYFTCPEAVVSFLHLERPYLPRVLWEPAAGNGAISNLLQRAGYDVIVSDIHDYGLSDCRIADYFRLKPFSGVEGIVTNPPYKSAQRFVEKAIREVPYAAFLLRSNFLIEATERDDFLETHPPTRVWHASLRLPMMHREGWTGKQAPSITPYSWIVWDARANRPELPRRFNWRKITSLPQWRGWLPE